MTGSDSRSRTAALAPVLPMTAVGLIGFAAAMGIGRFAFTPLLPLMQQEGLLSVDGGGVLASVHFVGYLAGALSGVWLPASARLVIALSLACIAVATAAMGLSDAFAVWVIARFVAGVSSAFVLVSIGSQIVSRLGTAGRADLQGWVFSGVGGGIAVVGTVTLAMMIAGVESRTGWLVFAAMVVPAALLAWLAAPPGGIDAPAAASAPSAAPLDWPRLIAYGATGAGYIIPATFLPVMARDVVSDPVIFGWGWPLFGLAAFLSTLPAAWLYGRYSNLRIWRCCQLVLAAGLVLPVLFPGLAAILAAALCVGGTFMIITMAGIKRAQAIANGDVQRHVAAFTTAFALGQMIAPVLAGWAYTLFGGFAVPLVATSLLLAVTAPGIESLFSGKRG